MGATAAQQSLKDRKFEAWRHGLLDVSKRNKMLNYRKTKRTTLGILTPDFYSLFQRITDKEETITFQTVVDCSADLQISQLFYLMDRIGAPVAFTRGEIVTDRPAADAEKTLKALRSKAKLSLDEQGINILYLSFGFLEWRQKPSDDPLLSPLILVPVALSREDYTSSYRIYKIDEDIVVNPTLTYVLQNDYGIALPNFEAGQDDIRTYFTNVEKVVREAGWQVRQDVNLGLLSFLKIVMYNDLEKYKERIFQNPVIAAFCGDPSGLPIIEDEWLEYNHDHTRPQDTYQVVNADASQQDAILLSKKGVSFVLQGPPGTGKSQTITNIIAEGLADGKKILFVSEKMAALSVVYKRLKEVNLADYCLSLHNYKADRKTVIADLVHTLDAPGQTLKPGVMNFMDDLETERSKLDQYFEELHTVREPLGRSIYDVLSELATLDTIPTWKVDISVRNMNGEQYAQVQKLLKKYSEFAKDYKKDIRNNPWNGTNITVVGYDTQNIINEEIQRVNQALFDMSIVADYLHEQDENTSVLSWNDFYEIAGAIASVEVMYQALHNHKDYRVKCFPHMPQDEEAYAFIQKFQSSTEGIASFDDLLISSKVIELRQSLCTVINTSRELLDFIESYNNWAGTDFAKNGDGYKGILKQIDAFSPVRYFERIWFVDNNYDRAESALITADKLRQKISEERLLLNNEARAVISGDYSQKLAGIKVSYEFWRKHQEEVLRQKKDMESKLEKIRCLHINECDIQTKVTRGAFEENQKIKVTELCEIIRLAGCYASLYEKAVDYVSIQSVTELLCIPYAFSIQGPTIEARDHFQQTLVLLKESLNLVERLNDEVSKERTALLSLWTEEFLLFDGNELFNRFKVDYVSMFRRLSGQYRQDKRTMSIMRKDYDGKLSDADCLKGLADLNEYKNNCIRLRKSEQTALDLLKTLIPDMNALPEDKCSAEKMLKACDSMMHFWLQEGLNNALAGLMSQPVDVRLDFLVQDQSLRFLTSPKALERYQYLTDKYGRTNLSEKSDLTKTQIDAIVELDSSIDCMRQTIVNILHAENYDFTGQVYEDIALDSIQQLYGHFQDLTDMFCRFDAEANKYQELFNRAYCGIDSDWTGIRLNLEQAKGLHQYTLEKSVPENVWMYLDEGVCIQDGMIISKQRSRADEMEKFCADRVRLLEFAESASEFVDLKKNSEEKLQQLALIDKYRQEIISWLPEGREEISKDLINRMLTAINIQTSLEEGIRRLVRVRLQEKFGLHPTNESQFQELWDYFEPYCDSDEIAELAVDLLNALWMQDIRNITLEIHDLAIDLLAGIEKEKSLQSPGIGILDTFDKWFPDIDFRTVPMDKLSNKIAACSDLEELNSWITYNEIYLQARELGVDTYLGYVQGQNIPPKKIVPIYRKSFLLKWYYETLEAENISGLGNFQSYAHEASIGIFKNLDHRQLRVAQARLSEKLSNKKPSSSLRMANAGDEVSILRWESKKKRRIMPLRRLFRAIPNLLQRLKPCFMMSPLSVSYFLDSEMYAFDMVIFDEASQILPEDAVGAIYRGKQVIIAGDTRQMPPTNFFRAASNNTDFEFDEDDDDYYDEILSESVLDEANTCLPSCTLLWHYRSKDESLIAFSNSNIYDNKLITFPNHCKVSDKGLEYVYVPDGYYVGGGKNCNVKEAERCVRLVEEHIHSHPKRSLGVIAFSEKQQGVIEEAIVRFRMRHPEYDEFFSEDKEEPFFVKNLENVQGDERDTIIFSICYARTKNGRLHMRFGPLGHAGGERRLNVAITRAKYNVKLVGSILPTDIDTSRTKAEGVRMLREYIFYAMQNDSGLEEGAGSEYHPEDLFPEVIATFLNLNGYGVRRNIGASEYKIDIAVLSPDSQDEYCAGIECDGPNYSMARTARDRDVLRKDIMSSMGWNIYHVWSAAWISNPEKEGEKLLAFLRKATKGSAIGAPEQAAALSMRCSEEQTTQVHEKEDVHNMMDEHGASEVELTLKFADYEISNPRNAKYVPRDGNMANLERGVMYVLEREQPIQEDLLYKRLAPVFGREKVTDPVRRAVYLCLLQMQDDVTIRNGFVYLNSAPITPRKSKIWEEPREIEQISPEELQAALYEVVKFAMSLTPEDLIAETARAFGYARTGSKIKQALSYNMGIMLESGRLKESDGRIYAGGKDA